LTSPGERPILIIAHRLKETMMRCSRFAGGGLLLLVSIAGAHAQMPPPSVGNATPAAVPMSWAGPYLGLQLGAVRSRKN
jgi:hypothetical protein